MGPDVPPPPARMEAKADTIYSSIQDWMQQNFWTIGMDDTKLAKEGGNRSGAELESRGQINRMRLPAGWLASAEQTGIAGTGTFLEYHPPASPDTNICFFYRGRGVNAQSAETFHNLIDQPSHLLKPEELKSIGEILRDKADEDNFSVLSARTKTMNGKNVLVVEGRYRKIQEDTTAIYVDADGTGKFVQEIYFQAPKADYQKHLKEARAAFDTIVWK